MDKVGLVFPGQGSQYIEMSKKLYSEYEIVQQTFKEASEILGRDFEQLIFHGSLLDISKLENSLTAIFIVSVAYYRVYIQETGFFPAIVAGHSLGEYAALTASGVLSFRDALELVQYRSDLANKIVEEGSSSMSIVEEIDVATVEELCNKFSTEDSTVSISCYNSKKQVAISGTLEKMSLVEEEVFKAGGKVTPLFGNAPFHCSIMNEISKEFRQKLKNVEFMEPRWPIMSNITGKPYKNADEIRELLVKQLTSPVQWANIMDYFEEYGVTKIIEIGPKNVLGKLLSENISSDIEIISFDQIEERKQLIQYFHENERYMKMKPTVISKCLAAAIATPNQEFDNQKYQDGVVLQVKKLKELQMQAESDNSVTIEMMNEAISALKIILQTKKIDESEQKEWFSQILDDTSMRYKLTI